MSKKKSDRHNRSGVSGQGPTKGTTQGTAKDTHYANLRRAHRDRLQAEAAERHPASSSLQPPETVHLYGLHTVRAALDNTERVILRMMASKNALTRLGINETDELSFPLKVVQPSAIDHELGADAIHQGVMIEARTLSVRRLVDLVDSRLLLVLDQVTDPHNVGAIMRSAVAFGAGAVITTMRHSPHESGVMAKSASGALERIPYVQVTNLADAIGELHALGFRTIGLDSEGDVPMETALAGDRIALVLGAEGKGLRQKTRQSVSALARLEMPGPIKSLNVSNAAAIALYATHRHLTTTS